MGVPSFYTWLVAKYPKVVCDAVEEEGVDLDCSLPNPNGMEFDNFYLDMNGIIHPCFHPEDNLFPPTSYNEVFDKIYEYIDHLFSIVRPRKLLFLAIDGVAPRAKMNQQRARRFRTAKDIQTAEETEENFRKQFEREGKAVLPKEESQVSDSNVITPGTEFMHMLSENLQRHITIRMRENSSWTNIKVILSDDNVPGEGEHKIMSFIRAQRSLPEYDPNTRHCLYGPDADLIMLALATHEIHFSILRDEVVRPKDQPSNVTTIESSIDKATDSRKSRGWFKEHPWEESSSDSVIESNWPVNKRKRYQFLNIWVLREYLALDLGGIGAEDFECDLERIIDDFIFICFFAGNDFLPHLPSLQIREGCIDLMMSVYKKEFQNLGGYLVNMQKVEDKKGGYLKLKRVEKFALMVGTYEEKIFSKRSHIRERNLRRILAEYRDAKEDEKNAIDDGSVSDIVCAYDVSAPHRDLLVSESPVDNDTYDTVLANTKELKEKMKEYLRNQSDLFKDGSLGTDKVNFGMPGWRERYYEAKFSARDAEEIEAIRKDVVEKYGEGLCWVLLYYFSGVPSWTWFYPYHYGPFVSDLKGLSHTKVKFQKGLPFKPFDQLMAVLPPRSSHALPSSYEALMSDENSNIIDFYPTEFETDFDGKRFMWQGISKLPFIEEERLLTETSKLENELKEYEKKRNAESLDRLFVKFTNKEDRFVLYGGTTKASNKIKDAIIIDSTIEGIKGTIHLMPDDLIEEDFCVFYEINPGFQNVPRLLEGVNVPEKIVLEDDITETFLWHEPRNGNSFRNRRPVNPQHTFEKSSSHDRTPPASIPKYGGRGFTLGRGKSPADSSDYNFRPGGGDANRMSPSSSYGGRGYHQPYHANSEHNVGRANAGFCRRDDYGGFRGLRISDPNTRPVLNSRSGQVRNDFSPAGGGASGDWRVRQQPSRDDVVGDHVSGSGPARIHDGWQGNYVAGAGPARIRGSWQGNYVAGAGPARIRDGGQGNYVAGAGPAPIVQGWQGNRAVGPRPVGDAWNQVAGAGRAPVGDVWGRNGAGTGPIWDAQHRNRAAGPGPGSVGDGWQSNRVVAGPAPIGDFRQGSRVTGAGPARNADSWRSDRVEGAGAAPVASGRHRNDEPGVGPVRNMDTGRGGGRGRGWVVNRN